MAPFVYTSDKLNSSFNKTFVGKTFVAETLQITPGYFTQQYKKKKSVILQICLFLKKSVHFLRIFPTVKESECWSFWKTGDMAANVQWRISFNFKLINFLKQTAFKQEAGIPSLQM